MESFRIDVPRWWARRAVPVLAVAALVLVAACSGESEEGAGATAPPEPTQAAITAVDYLALFNKVSAGTVESVGVLNQLALIVSANDEARTDLRADVQVLISSIGLQLDVLKNAEPVPPDLIEAHESLKTALSRYIDAATLLLPLEQGGPDEFDFFTFQPLVQEAGENFHGAGNALP